MCCTLNLTFLILFLIQTKKFGYHLDLTLHAAALFGTVIPCKTVLDQMLLSAAVWSTLWYLTLIKTEVFKGRATFWEMHNLRSC